MNNHCTICDRTFSSKYTLLRHNNMFHKNDDENEYESQETSTSGVNDNSNNDSDDSQDSRPINKKRKRSRRNIDNSDLESSEEDESEEESHGSYDNEEDENEEFEIIISKKTIQLLENMVIASEIGTFTLTKLQIKNAVNKKEQLEDTDNDSDSDEDMEEEENDEDDELDINSLKFLRHLFSAANKGILKLNIRMLYSILDCITPQ